jgi:hypothetical protein
MGYETTLIVVETTQIKKNGQPHDYMRVVATVELCKATGKHLDSLRIKKSDEDYLKDINRLEELQNIMYDREGNYNEEFKKLSATERKKIEQEDTRLSKKIRKQLPFIFHTSHNNENYTDSYGDVLMIADVRAVYTAILKDQADLIVKGEYEHGYRRYTAALKMLEAFLNEKEWPRLKVVLWGH